MALSKSRFRPGLWPTLAALLVCALFLRLGWWQWQRAQYKETLIAEYAARTARAPVSLNAVLADSTLESLPRYLHLTADGVYDGARQLLLEDMTHEGQVGYEVLTPFLLQPGGSILLVDRGWVAADARGAAPAVDVTPGARRIEGVLNQLPVPGLKVGTPAPPAAGWPKQLFYPDLRELKGFYGPAFTGLVVQLAAAQPDGYLREAHAEVGFPPERHLAYAFQWLLMAIAVAALWLVLNLRRGRREMTDGG